MFRKSLRVVAAIAAVLTMAGCSDGRDQSRLAGPSGVVRDGETDERESACTSDGARLVVERFLGADHADAEAVVDAYIAPESAFQWFSTRERIAPDALDRSSLSGYLSDRHRRQVQQDLEDFTFNGVDGGHGNFGFTLRESSPDAVLHYPGKGAVDCVSGKLMVWSEGAPR